jgi:hypothetical protein
MCVMQLLQQLTCAFPPSHAHPPGLHHSVEAWRKPFNPILGETWQATMPGGLCLYMEQVRLCVWQGGHGQVVEGDTGGCRTDELCPSRVLCLQLLCKRPSGGQVMQ